MRDPERIDRIIEKLREAWKLAPDQRLAQLVTNAVIYGVNYQMDGIFGIDDDATELGLDRMLEELKNPKPETPVSAAVKAFVHGLRFEPPTR